MIGNSIQPLSHGMQYPPPLLPKEISFLPFTTLFGNFPVVFYLLIQRYIVTGLSAGAVKG